MKSPSKVELRSFLDRLKVVSKRHSKRRAELAEAKTDHASFISSLEELGTPDYRNDAALQQVVTTQIKLNSCGLVIEKLEEELANLSAHQACALIKEGASLTGLVLEPIREEIVADIAKAFRPFFESDFRARNGALASDMACVALGRLQQYNGLENWAHPGLSNPEKIQECLVKIETVLTEAQKENPILRPFLLFNANLDEKPAAAPAAA